jgi:DNA-binding transcriptional regulator/RsmH inhibitor MraZ
VDQPESSTAARPRGRTTSKLDEKNRLKFPVEFTEYFRSIGAIRFFVTGFGDPVARVYPEAVWDKVEAALSEPGPNAPLLRKRLFKAHDLGGNAELDSQGRITFPQQLREELKLNGTVLHYMWMKDHVQVYTHAEYQAKKEETPESVQEGLDVMATMGMV